MSLLIDIGIGFEDESLKPNALALSKAHHWPIASDKPYLIWVSHQGVGLKKQGMHPVYVDFLESDLKRLKDAKQQGVVKACRPAKNRMILDATAGWCRDASLLAYEGATVLLCERSPFMQVLIQDGLERMKTAGGGLDLTLMQTDAITYLNQLSPQDYPDVIYIDPMHPKRQKSALVKKDMQLLQQLLGPDDDAKELLQLALSKTKERVVVKWPTHIPPLLPPKYTINGKTVSFAVY